MRAIPCAIVLGVCLMPPPPVLAADSPAARRGATGAAERVQEGNVQQWIEYYERERLQRARPPGAEPPRSETPAPTTGTADIPPAKP